MAHLQTALTHLLSLRHPIISAPMAFAAGGELAAAVSRHGGLGLIGGGYGDAAWLEEQLTLAGDAPVGVGFITWSLQQQPELLTQVLIRKPVAIMLSFGDATPFVDEIRRANATLIMQCQTLEHVEQAADAEADVIVVQGTEAGGHGALRSTLTLVPEAADYLKRRGSDAVLVAAGGIGDGRGVAASLMLGAQGVLVGTRFWACKEALVYPAHHEAILEANGDGTVRTHVVDIAREIAWPEEFTARIRDNAFTRRWHTDQTRLREEASTLAPAYLAALRRGDVEEGPVFYGEVAGLIHDLPSAGEILTRMTKEAVQCLETSWVVRD